MRTPLPDGRNRSAAGSGHGRSAKVLIVESCRSPELDKGDTEAILLSRFFAEAGIPFLVHTNDHVWVDHADLEKSSLEDLLRRIAPSIVHLAVHGETEGLVLRWSGAPDVADRRPVDVLTPPDIESMAAWKGRLVVSGACFSGLLAESFLKAGATSVVAPTGMIPWPDLGSFFRRFYELYVRTISPEVALADATRVYPEYASYRVFRSGADKRESPAG